MNRFRPFKFPAAVLLGILLAGVTVLTDAWNGEDEDSFFDREMSWRENRDRQMKSSSSWLTIAGLFWLKEGKNTFGTSSACDIRLPAASAPDTAGYYSHQQGKTALHSAQGAEIKWKNQTIRVKENLKTDESGQPDILELNDLRMWVIRRGERFAIRLRDLNNPAYKSYKGLDYFPPDRRFKIRADYTAFEQPKNITVATMIGTDTPMQAAGYVRFSVEGQECRLLAFGDGKGKQLFFIFSDATSGRETYGASRFMSARILESGRVDLNFNRAYNPPCAYTPYATCPLPPPENHLQVPIEAGEKKYPGSSHC
jgi:uncharacterized protein (DUF1684 family)